MIWKVKSDVNLSLALREHKPENGKHFIFQIPNGKSFIFKNVVYKKGNIRRTRIECLNMNNHKVYLFNQNVEVELYPL